MLQKMRGKLSEGSKWELQQKKLKTLKRRNTRSQWVLTLLIMGLVVGIQGALMKKASFSITEFKVVKKVDVLSDTPKKMKPDEEALFWTYALYDFKKLRKEFNIPKKTIVNHQYAKERLEDLKPQVSVETLGKIAFYTSPRSAI